MTEITPYEDEADEKRGLDIANAVWSHDRISIDEARSFRASLLDQIHLVARIDGHVGGSASGAIEPSWPEVVSAYVTVLPEQRHRGAGTGFYEVISDWARAPAEPPTSGRQRAHLERRLTSRTEAPHPQRGTRQSTLSWDQVGAGLWISPTSHRILLVMSLPYRSRWVGLRGRPRPHRRGLYRQGDRQREGNTHPGQM